MEQNKIVKIVRPERIARIIERVCEARLDVLVRVPGHKKVAVKAKATACEPQGKSPSILLSGLSSQGVRFLWNTDVVQVDFVGMSTQMIFKTRVLTVEGSSVRLIFPKMLVSYDRRKNARYATTDQLAVFCEADMWRPRDNDITAPPIFYPYDDLSNWVKVADLSEGGFCGVARFPSVLDTYQRGVVDRNAKLVFPMQFPMEAPIEIRWTRRIRESLATGEDNFSQRFFKFGAQFVDPNKQLIKNLKQFFHQVSMSDAI